MFHFVMFLVTSPHGVILHIGFHGRWGLGWGGQTIEDAKSLTMEKCRNMLEGLEGNPLPPIALPEDSTLRHG